MFFNVYTRATLYSYLIFPVTLSRKFCFSHYFWGFHPLFQFLEVRGSNKEDLSVCLVRIHTVHSCCKLGEWGFDLLRWSFSLAEDFEMQRTHQFSRFNTLELKAQIIKKIGKEKSEMYFSYIRKFLGFKLSHLDFSKLCHSALGKENIGLHNLLIRLILRNAHLSNAPPEKRTSTGHSRDSTITNGHLGEMILASPHKERSVNSRFHKVRDRPSVLGRHGKVNGAAHDRSNSNDQQRLQEFVSIGSKALGSVEDGEEVEQEKGSPGVQSRSPIRAPLGISMTTSSSAAHKHLRVRLGDAFRHPTPLKELSDYSDTGISIDQLELELKCKGLSLSPDCVDLLNSGAQAYLKRLIKPFLELARARSNIKTINGGGRNITSDIRGTRKREAMHGLNKSYQASLVDFQVAMKLNPHLLGKNLSTVLEKIPPMS